jgi:hypothetical protein
MEINWRSERGCATNDAIYLGHPEQRDGSASAIVNLHYPN